MHPVRLETRRLTLDAHTQDDFGSLAAMWADPSVVRHIGGRPSTRQESWFRLLRYGGLWPLLGYGYWAIRERQSGRFVGDVGFADFRRETEWPMNGIPEAGWVLAGWASGQGFATEALAAALDWLDRCGVHRRSVCLIAPANRGSLRVAEKNGFLTVTSVKLAGSNTLLLVRNSAPAALL